MQKVSIYRLISLSLLINVISIKAEQKRLVIVNDTKERVRVKYPRKTGKEIKKVLMPGKRFSYAQGSASIYVPSENGTYTVTIPSPRPVGSLKKLTLTQIMQAAKQKERMGPHGYYTEKGQIGDVKIFFEKIPFFAD